MCGPDCGPEVLACPSVAMHSSRQTGILMAAKRGLIKHERSANWDIYFV
jgi:hypothetical protein